MQQVLGTDANVPVIASSDYMRAVPEQVAPYLNNRLLALGTDDDLVLTVRRVEALSALLETEDGP